MKSHCYPPIRIQYRSRKATKSYTTYAERRNVSPRVAQDASDPPSSNPRKHPALPSGRVSSLKGTLIFIPEKLNVTNPVSTALCKSQFGRLKSPLLLSNLPPRYAARERATVVGRSIYVVPESRTALRGYDDDLPIEVV